MSVKVISAKSKTQTAYSSGKDHDDSVSVAPKGKNSAARKEMVINLDQPGFQRIQGVLTIFPVSRSAWYEGIADGRYPAGVQLGKRSVAWSNESLKKLIIEVSN